MFQTLTVASDSFYYAFTTKHCRQRRHVFGLSVRRVRPFVWTDLVATISHEIYRDYSLVPTEDLIRVCRSKVKVTTGHRGGEGIHVNAGVSKLVVKT